MEALNSLSQKNLVHKKNWDALQQNTQSREHYITGKPFECQTAHPTKHASFIHSDFNAPNFFGILLLLQLDKSTVAVQFKDLHMSHLGKYPIL